MLNPSISILGCGWLGKPLAIYFLENQFKVKGSTTTSSKQSELEEKGIETFVFNLKDELPDDFFNSDFLIIDVPPQDLSLFNNLIHKINNQQQLKGVVIVSSTSVFDDNNEVKNENSAINQSLPAKIERLFSERIKVPLTIVRFGGLFGPQRNPIDFLQYFNSIKNPEGFINFIHLDDCIQILFKIIEQQKFNKIYNAVMPHHPKREAFYHFLSDWAQQPRKQIESQTSHWKIVNSQKLIQDFNYYFIHENIFEASKK